MSHQDRNPLAARSWDDVQRFREAVADWSLVALWAVCLSAQREIGESGGAPCRLSPAGAIKAIQQTMGQYRNRPDGPNETLWRMLALALQDDYQRTSDKTARAYPRKTKRERTGVPKITTALKSQVTAAQRFKKTRAEFRLPA